MTSNGPSFFLTNQTGARPGEELGALIKPLKDPEVLRNILRERPETMGVNAKQFFSATHVAPLDFDAFTLDQVLDRSAISVAVIFTQPSGHTPFSQTIDESDDTLCAFESKVCIQELRSRAFSEQFGHGPLVPEHCYCRPFPNPALASVPPCATGNPLAQSVSVPLEKSDNLSSTSVTSSSSWVPGFVSQQAAAELSPNLTPRSGRLADAISLISTSSALGLRCRNPWGARKDGGIDLESCVQRLECAHVKSPFVERRISPRDLYPVFYFEALIEVESCGCLGSSVSIDVDLSVCCNCSSCLLISQGGIEDNCADREELFVRSMFEWFRNPPFEHYALGSPLTFRRVQGESGDFKANSEILVQTAGMRRCAALAQSWIVSN
ncbi:hypothetical protein Tco_0150755 [Tanacetum coccineum]